MMSITEEIYADIASRLREQIGELPFFNGTIEHSGEDFQASLRCTLIVRKPGDPGNHPSAPCGILPVWWEYHLYRTEGEQETDFSWQELSRQLPA